MNELVYPRERSLGAITLVLGILIWIALIVGTFGGALAILLLGYIAYLFAQSALIAHIKGNGVELTETQFPDLYAQFNDCCARLQLIIRPQAYILNGNGGLNAFATQFLGTQYVVLMSDVVDAMDQHTDGVRFYIGHELGHLRMKHLAFGHLLRWPALWLPLLGAAYSRARESTCDRHGLACSNSPEAAARALVVLSAGVERWQKLDLNAYLQQAKHGTGFWMSFHELIAGYPWLTKRAARILNPDDQVPRRNIFAYLLAVFIPYAGRLGGGFALLMMIYVIGLLAAIAIPAYHDYTVTAKLEQSVLQSQGARQNLSEYYLANQQTPASLEAAGIASSQADGSVLQLNPTNMELTVSNKHGALVFIPSQDKQGHISWSCTNGEGVKPAQLPPACRRLNQ
jgi:Zn-dependent protease with chaperone function/type II secretory pathway pseudopilin PulG